MQVEMPQRLAAEKWSLVRQEALAMATIMRQNARFSGASKVVGEHRLLRGFTDIRRLFTPDEPVINLIRPFIDVVKSADTTGHESAAALASLAIIVDRGVVSSGRDLREVVEGALGTQFQNTDSAVDDIVVCRMLEVFVAAFQSPASKELDGDLVVETVRLVMKARLEPRLSDALRVNAEISLSRMLSSMFGRLASMLEEEEFTLHRSPSLPPSFPGALPEGEAGDGNESDEEAGVSKKAFTEWESHQDLVLHAGDRKSVV